MMPRTIDPTLPEDETNDRTNSITERNFPRSYEKIPKSSRGLKDCALHQIQGLLTKSPNLTAEEEDAVDDGFVLCDLNVIRRKLLAWRRMFPRIKPFFAIKCNPDVMVAAVLGQFESEVGFDCASISEIKLAMNSTGGHSKRCIYANPQRAESDLREALSVGVEALTFDGVEELEKVSRAHQRRCQEWHTKEPKNDESNGSGQNDMGPPKPPEMILRILVPDSHSAVPLGEKFGAPPSRVEALAEKSLDLGLPVIGVSFHCGSGCHDPEAYGTAIRLAKDAMAVIDKVIDRRSKEPTNNTPHLYKKCTLLDIGGGYPGLDGDCGDIGRFCGSISAIEETTTEDTNAETAAKIAQLVSPLIDTLYPKTESDMHIISEPGRYFVESAFALCCRIYSSKTEEQDNGIHRMHYYIAQGLHGVFKDVLLCGEVFTPIPLRLPGEDQFEIENNAISPSDEHFPSTLHGPSGEEYDVVNPDCSLPLLNVGDWLIFDRMGAYTLSIAARDGSLPVRYVFGGDS